MASLKVLLRGLAFVTSLGMFGLSAWMAGGIVDDHGHSVSWVALALGPLLTAIALGTVASGLRVPMLPALAWLPRGNPDRSIVLIPVYVVVAFFTSIPVTFAVGGPFGYGLFVLPFWLTTVLVLLFSMSNQPRGGQP
jgi:hypothetical protein